MNHNDWLSVLFNVLTVLLSTLGAHIGAKNGANTDNK